MISPWSNKKIMRIKDIQKALQEEKPYRFKQAKEAVYHQYISSWDEATGLSKFLRAKLKEVAPLEIRGELTGSLDGKTSKALISFGSDRVETVLMRHPDRNTVCVSSQVGCAMGCQYCRTGQIGLKRDLVADEIVGQVLFFARLLKRENKQVTNVVFMGMGEPLANYSEVMQAVRVLNQEMGIGARRISVSTVGLSERIKDLAREPEQINLAVSLNAPDDALRSRLMPVNRAHSIKNLMAALREYIDKTHRKVMIEYIMLKGVNDDTTQAHALAELLERKLKSHYVVNLISYNPTETFAPSDEQTIKKFADTLKRHDVPIVQRYKFGRDIKAACGQLAGES